MTIQNDTGGKAEGRSEQSPANLETQIRATRSAISEDLRALGEKVSPAHLKEEAYETVRGVAHSARESASRRIGEQARRAQEQVQRARDNPLFTAGCALMLGFGLGLILPVSQAEARALAGPVSKVREQTRGILDEGQQAARRLRDGARETTEQVKQAVQEE